MRNVKPVAVGHLHEDLTALAGRIQFLLTDGDHLVWADDDGSVFLSTGGLSVDVPGHWIAGVFGMGHPLRDIEGDLRALLRERSKDWISEAPRVALA